MKISGYFVSNVNFVILAMAGLVILMLVVYLGYVLYCKFCDNGRSINPN